MAIACPKPARSYTVAVFVFWLLANHGFFIIPLFVLQGREARLTVSIHLDLEYFRTENGGGPIIISTYLYAPFGLGMHQAGGTSILAVTNRRAVSLITLPSLTGHYAHG